MSKAIKLIRSGDNQEYQIENLEKQSLKEGQVLVKNIASGINEDDPFINIPADAAIDLKDAALNLFCFV